MGEYRITVSMTEHGRPDVAEANAEQLLTAFEETHPEVGAAVGANLAEGWLEVTYSVEAESAEAAFTAGQSIYGAAGAASGLKSTPLARIEVEATSDERELVPA